MKRKPPEVSVVAEDLLNSITQRGTTRRLLSSTFWAEFGFQTRTKDRIAAVKAALQERGIQILRPAADQFGEEPHRAWIELGIGAVQPTPPTPAAAPTTTPTAAPVTDDWFTEMAGLRFESEEEVESFFIIPLLFKLGYSIDDIAQGWTVTIMDGCKPRKLRCDFCLFDGVGRENDAALLVVESKRTGRRLAGEAENQARCYAMWLSAPTVVATNGDEIRVYENYGPPKPTILVTTITRAQLRDRWEELVGRLSKKAVMARKAQIAETLKRARTAGSSNP